MKKGLLYFITMCGILMLASCGISKNENSEQITTQQMTEKSENLAKEKETGTTEKQEEVLKIAIDAGHQLYQNSELEPIGPGASEEKMKVASGTEGVNTKNPEYEVTLQVSKKLKKVLENRGYEVFMVREENDVDLSNKERAEMANRSGADIFLRIHCNSVDDASVQGAVTLCPDEQNPYCEKEMISKSSDLSQIILDKICEKTGAKKLSMIRTSDMSGINWCKIPVSIIEMGFMSNPEEDEKLGTDEYQESMAEGIANGVDAYYERGE